MRVGRRALWVIGAETPGAGESYEDVLAASRPPSRRRRFTGGGFNMHDLHVGHDRPAERHRASADPADRASYAARHGRPLGVHGRRRHLVAGPLYHTGPASYAQLHLLIGATVVIMPHFDAAEALRADRAAPRHQHFHGADALQPHPAARRRRARAPRPVVAAPDHALRRAVPAAREARHHRGVSAAARHRVLRRLGERLHADHRRGVAAQAGQRRHAVAGPRGPHPRRGGHGRCRRARSD